MIAGDVHIWSTFLDWGNADIDRFRAILDDEELDHAARFHSPISRRRFTAKHAIRRLVLAEYLGAQPQDIVFATGVAGKPQIEGGRRLHFNDSASGALAVYAVARDMDLGIDIEAVRAVPDAPGIVERFGSPTERAEFQQLGPADRRGAFLRWWTAKEGVVKAIGDGLQQGLDRFSVSFPSSSLPQNLRLLEISGEGDAAARFSLMELRPAGGYVGTLVAIGRPMRVLLRQWSPSHPRVGLSAC